MSIVRSAATQPHWAPVQAVVPDLFTWLIYMSVVTQEDGNVIHQYKHAETGKYINLDDNGQAWAIKRSTAVPITVAEAREAVE